MGRDPFAVSNRRRYLGTVQLPRMVEIAIYVYLGIPKERSKGRNVNELKKGKF